MLPDGFQVFKKCQIKKSVEKSGNGESPASRRNHCRGRKIVRGPGAGKRQRLKAGGVAAVLGEAQREWRLGRGRAWKRKSDSAEGQAKRGLREACWVQQYAGHWPSGRAPFGD